ncbi:thioredoxin-disulfide reductase [Streptomyces thioluteus]|uniref:Thioredoxin-disulfide reductase n=1 Tax=Streptomyces thioluteus TaxID=66431 RepID=A0ABN3WV80_STRTU
MSDVRNVIIIGSGPAGYTAALYTARASLKPLVFEGSVTAGGALMETTDVENFPGFREGIMGPDLMDNMRAQAERFGAELIPDDITAVDLSEDIKTVTDSAGTVHRAKAVIVATGSQHRKLGLPREDELSGRGISWCATCDGFFFKEKDIVVVGGGDTAMEEATFLSRFAKTVTIVHRRDALRASKAMQDRAFADPKISFVWNSEIAEIHGENKLTGLTLRDVKTGETSELPVEGLFIAVGHDPAPSSSRVSWSWTTRATSRSSPPPPGPTSRASSPPVTSWTTPTARRSPPRAPAAPPPWTRSASSPPSVTA